MREDEVVEQYPTRDASRLLNSLRQRQNQRVRACEHERGKRERGDATPERTRPLRIKKGSWGEKIGTRIASQNALLTNFFASTYVSTAPHVWLNSGNRAK